MPAAASACFSSAAPWGGRAGTPHQSRHQISIWGNPSSKPTPAQASKDGEAQRQPWPDPAAPPTREASVSNEDASIAAVCCRRSYALRWQQLRQLALRKQASRQRRQQRENLSDVSRQHARQVGCTMHSAQHTANHSFHAAYFKQQNRRPRRQQQHTSELSAGGPTRPSTQPSL